MEKHTSASAMVREFRLEEEIRAEIRKEIQATSAKQGIKAWDLLNSAFGLWLLSAIFISGAGSIYTKHQNENKERLQKDEAQYIQKQITQKLIDRLAMEFSYRLSASLVRLQNASEADKSKTDPPLVVAGALRPLSNAPDNSYSALYPEFSNRSGLSLLAELSTISPGGERDELKDIIAKLTALIQSPDVRKRDRTLLYHQLAGELLNRTRHWRWKTGFIYTDCDPKKPFC